MRIYIIEVFVKMRAILLGTNELLLRMEQIEKKSRVRMKRCYKFLITSNAL
jgi:hypothetical protein